MFCVKDVVLAEYALGAKLDYAIYSVLQKILCLGVKTVGQRLELLNNRGIRV